MHNKIEKFKSQKMRNLREEKRGKLSNQKIPRKKSKTMPKKPIKMHLHLFSPPELTQAHQEGFSF